MPVAGSTRAAGLIVPLAILRMYALVTTGVAGSANARAGSSRNSARHMAEQRAAARGCSKSGSVEIVDERGAALLAQIYERPDDAAARQVYADWLQERGDERA